MANVQFHLRIGGFQLYLYLFVSLDFVRLKSLKLSFFIFLNLFFNARGLRVSIFVVVCRRLLVQVRDRESEIKGLCFLSVY